MNISRTILLRKATLLFVMGAIGVASVLPIIPKLVGLTGEDIPIPVSLLQLISFLQSSFFLLITVGLGLWLAPKVNLKTPLIDSLLSSNASKPVLTSRLIWALTGGVLGGILIVLVYAVMSPALPETFLSNANQFKLPVVTRLLYGGITEELLIRWGLMTVLVFGFSRIFWKNQPEAAIPYLLGIAISAVLFAVGHLPVTSLLADTLTAPLIVYVLLGNSLFGFIAGYLYWKQGLETAIIAHMIAHLTMLIGELLLA